MPINKPKKAVRAGALHGGNEEDIVVEESGQGVENNMSVDTLIDPEDYEAGSTYTSVTAAAVDDCDAGSPLNPGTTNVGTIDNDVEPATGYLEGEITAEVEEEDDLGEDDEMDEGDDDGEDPFAAVEETASPETVTLENNNIPQSVTGAEGGDDDWDAPPADDDGMDDDVEDIPEDDDAGVAVEDLEEEPQPEEAAPTDEDMSILDMDGTDDTEVDDVMFATAGTRVVVLKANRVIASMTARMAIKGGKHDVYLGEQFAEVSAAQIKASGLRRGLKQMGFALAKVNFAKAPQAIKAHVAKEVHKTTAAVRRVNADKDQAFEQSLAIAAVGINRRFFNDVENELKASFEGEFRRLGVRNAAQVVARVFAEHGPSYAKSVVELARKISGMPEEVRSGYVQALDMSSADMEVVEDESDMVPIGADDDDVMEEEYATSVHASLAVPGKKLQVSAAASGKYSVTANEILNGKRPLF